MEFLYAAAAYANRESVYTIYLLTSPCPFENEPVKRLVDICVVARVAHTTTIYVAMLLDPHISTPCYCYTTESKKVYIYVSTHNTIRTHSQTDTVKCNNVFLSAKYKTLLYIYTFTEKYRHGKR